MDARTVVLTVPSAVILAGLIWHSLVALPRRRAAGFWGAVAVFGLLRGLGVRWVTEAIGASFPYEIRNPMLSIGGVAVQEIAGWAVVAYLAWWAGERFSRRARRPYLFLQVAWASLFLGAISWAVEAAAIAARWWHWTVPTASRVFLNVPAIGIADWFFVGLDFVLPFVAITAPALAHSRLRWLTLLFFPAHFAGHLLPGMWLQVVHWTLVLIALALALRTTAEDAAFADRRNWLPPAALALMLGDIAFVELLLVRQPELLVSIVPALAIWLTAIRPQAATLLAAASVVGALAMPSLLVAAAARAGGSALLWLRRGNRTAIALAAVAAFAIALHARSAMERRDLTERLDAAIAARDRGNVQDAARQLDVLARDHPTAYAPLAMAAEIDYRLGRLDEAHAKLARAVAIKQDFVRGYRLLAAIDLQSGRRDAGIRWARQGLEVAPGDVQLRYLAGENIVVQSAEEAAGMVALAFEVGDLTVAQRMTEQSLARWPEDERLQRISARLNR